MKSQSTACLLNESEDIYWILDLEGEVHSIWDLWMSGLQKCKDNGFFFFFLILFRAGGQQFSVGSIFFGFYGQAHAPARIYLPRKVRGMEV